MIETMLRVVVVGVGATLVMDAWALILRRVYGVAGLDYRFVGRWLAHLLRGRVSHDAIAQAVPVRYERLTGWLAHYATGIAFAAVLVAVEGKGWLRAPKICPAILLGLVTVAAPLLILQPALGLGIAASRSPDPFAARLRSLITHLVFGAGLFISASVLAALQANQS